MRQRPGPRKKLIEGARHWARAPARAQAWKDYEDEIKALESAGIEREAAQRSLAARRPAPVLDFEVWPENWPAVRLFHRLSTQWRVAVGALGGRQYFGLDYAAAESLMRVYGTKNRGAVMDDLIVMEYSVLPVLNGADDEGAAGDV